MILEQSSSAVNTIGASQQYGMEVSEVSFEILSSSLYTNKERAVLREAAANALDSQRANGTAHIPVTIKLPSSFDPYLVISDCGIGMSKADIVSLYTNFFSSSKRTSNEFIGGFGIGSKSPFSIAESFTTISVKNGVKTTIISYLDEGKPDYSIVGSEETTEPSGTTIRIPVSDSDVISRLIAEASSDLFTYWEVTPKFTGVDNPIRINTFVRTAGVPNGDVVTKSVYYSDDRLNIINKLVIGDFAYTVPTALSKKIDNALASDKELNDLFNSTLVQLTSKSRQTINVSLLFSTGSIKLAPSRETVIDNANNLQVILKGLKEYLTYLSNSLTQNCEAITSHVKDVIAMVNDNNTFADFLVKFNDKLDTTPNLGVLNMLINSIVYRVQDYEQYPKSNDDVIKTFVDAERTTNLVQYLTSLKSLFKQPDLLDANYVTKLMFDKDVNENRRLAMVTSIRFEEPLKARYREIYYSKGSYKARTYQGNLTYSDMFDHKHIVKDVCANTFASYLNALEKAEVYGDVPYSTADIHKVLVVEEYNSTTEWAISYAGSVVLPSVTTEDVKAIRKLIPKTQSTTKVAGSKGKTTSTPASETVIGDIYDIAGDETASKYATSSDFYESDYDKYYIFHSADDAKSGYKPLHILKGMKVVKPQENVCVLVLTRSSEKRTSRFSKFVESKGDKVVICEAYGAEKPEYQINKYTREEYAPYAELYLLVTALRQAIILTGHYDAVYQLGLKVLSPEAQEVLKLYKDDTHNLSYISEYRDGWSGNIAYYQDLRQSEDVLKKYFSTSYKDYMTSIGITITKQEIEDNETLRTVLNAFSATKVSPILEKLELLPTLQANLAAAVKLFIQKGNQQ